MTDSTRMLDLEAVRAFVWIAQMRSFTRAAEALNSTQSALSLKLKKLEEHLGRRLLERTPRQVRLSAEGTAFLDAARALVDAHEQAIGTLHTPQRRLVIGLSHQIVGVQLPAVLRHMHSQQPQIQFELRVAGSRELLGSLDAGTLLKLPALPTPHVFLYSNLTDADSRRVLQNLAKAFKSAS